MHRVNIQSSKPVDAMRADLFLWPLLSPTEIYAINYKDRSRNKFPPNRLSAIAFDGRRVHENGIAKKKPNPQSTGHYTCKNVCDFVVRRCILPCATGERGRARVCVCVFARWKCGGNRSPLIARANRLGRFFFHSPPDTRLTGRSTHL